MFTTLAASYLLTSMRAPALAARHGRLIARARLRSRWARHCARLRTRGAIPCGCSANRRQLTGGSSSALGVAVVGVAFVETGRSRPSPEMVLNLANHLDVPCASVMVALEHELLSYPGPPADLEADPPPDAGVMVGLRLAAGDGTELAVFSTITTFGTPIDVTVSELSIEAFFPADETTAAALRAAFAA